MKNRNLYLADTSEDSMKVNAYINRRAAEEPQFNFRPERLKLLLSYHYFKSVDLTALMAKYFGDKPPMLFIDSGGFSAATQGVEINIDEYCEFLKKYDSLITVKANLDVIGNPEKTYEQQKYMESKGVRPIPVFHTGEPISWLKRYIDEGYDYIALGGMVPYARDKKKLVQWMSACFNEADKAGRPIGYHGFGMTNWDLMRAYPWKSVDSSSWCSGFRYGQVYLFDDKLGRFYQVGLRDIKKSYKYSKILEGIGFSPNDLALNSEFDRVKVATISALAFMKAEAWLNRSRARGGSPAERGESQGGQHEAVAGPNKHDGVSVSGPGRVRDGGGGSSDARDVFLVTLPPKDGSEHNPESKFVGGTQMFESFKNIYMAVSQPGTAATKDQLRAFSEIGAEK